MTTIIAEHKSLPDSTVVELARAGARDPVVCFSHLRWDFVFQRPQHLMTRFAQSRTVIYFEEPLPDDGDVAWIQTRVCPMSGVIIATPRLPLGLPEGEKAPTLKSLLDGLLAEQSVVHPVLWYYTPMMLPLSRHLQAAAVIYDCMDELANFRFAPPELRPLEQELIATADVVFTGGYSLYEAKGHLHANIHPFPSSVDRAHFAKARAIATDTTPTLGFYGVIDERMDLEMIAAVADARPDWTIVMVGPVVKISEDELPRRANIEYLGARSYDQLPAELGRWHVALMPFAINDSTQFISPTKTPEYLAGGRPVVSTPIRDVVRHYGALEAVAIAADAEAFVEACDAALCLAADPTGSWLADADAALADLSWDRTQIRMNTLVDRAANARKTAVPSRRPRGARMTHYDALVVGAGFAGAVLAERLASDAGLSVLVVDRRPHIGGNAYDRLDDAGVLIHEYGPHIFHTNSADVFAYLSRFTRWRPYEHRVLAEVGDKLVPMPINRTTLNQLYDLDLQTDEAAAEFLAARAEPVEKVRTSEDVVVSAVGRELYETFFQGYTRKQWGLDPSELDKSVTSRVPTRTNTDDRYFTDTFQAMPLEGYTRMFARMLDHENIRVETGVDYRDIVDEITFDQLIYTGPIDEFFDHCHGPLPYRSLRFQHETLDQEQFQSVATVNSPDEATLYTRVTEYKHLTGQVHPKTSVTFEYPTAEGDPYYPIPRPENQALFKQYEALAAGRTDVVFAGRLATYRYYNMDQVVGQALATYRKMARVVPAVSKGLENGAVAATL
ncbi:UDP-galactopyranose mutase [Brevundimonas sp.]|uniref:UDP-galactopyranose mutase n=1 Tax=Brevundimonas sp. TaxID=1871086 RepID=UPI00286CACB6|nr:UDP-galactopyranose mutase [Brevundimonas sp.]